MTTCESQLYFTHQFINMLTDGVNRSVINLDWIRQTLLPNIQRYPHQGRLFLNRTATNSDNQRLRWQLAQRFNCYELREMSENGWLILYLNELPRVYLLALIPLSLSDNQDFENEWREAD
ncbi:hypothetical protein SOASR032_06480 [Pragia fontium]|uniref:Uncharacterized protein n=1 Tax=Pragia fontium TaxID=82985 RepID=A0ABQ5LEP6_9GAMM|nr:hypothetical protein [Pragia fontium]GKX62079.1 hypothetical protein SOASR032_06480 [Pragia fontium]